MSKILDIAKGWTYSALSVFNLLSKETQQLSDDRMRVCNTCDMNTANIKNAGARPRCLMCNCFLPEKTFDKKQNCPSDKWEK